MNGQTTRIDEILALHQRFGRLLGETGSLDQAFDSTAKLVASTLLAKAAKTHEAILLLATNGYGEDAIILTRSLFNLAVVISWIFKGPSQRLDAYAAYDVVSKAKLGRKIVASQSTATIIPEVYELYQNRRSEWEDGERDFKDQYYSKRPGWSGKSIEEMANEVGLGGTYATFYTLASDIEHSNPASISNYLHDQPDGSKYVSAMQSENWVVEALFESIFFAAVVAKPADIVLGLGILTQLEAVEQDALNPAISYKKSE
jgi:hypothetical protein